VTGDIRAEDLQLAARRSSERARLVLPFFRLVIPLVIPPAVTRQVRNALSRRPADVSSQNGSGRHLLDEGSSTRNRKVEGSNPSAGSKTAGQRPFLVLLAARRRLAVIPLDGPRAPGGHLRFATSESVWTVQNRSMGLFAHRRRAELWSTDDLVGPVGRARFRASPKTDVRLRHHSRISFRTSVSLAGRLSMTQVANYSSWVTWAPPSCGCAILEGGLVAADFDSYATDDGDGLSDAGGFTGSVTPAR
jgi:hypothetical protein